MKIKHFTERYSYDLFKLKSDIVSIYRNILNKEETYLPYQIRGLNGYEEAFFLLNLAVKRYLPNYLQETSYAHNHKLMKYLLDNGANPNSITF